MSIQGITGMMSQGLAAEIMFNCRPGPFTCQHVESPLASGCDSDVLVEGIDGRKEDIRPAAKFEENERVALYRLQSFVQPVLVAGVLVREEFGIAFEEYPVRLPQLGSYLAYRFTCHLGLDGGGEVVSDALGVDSHQPESGSASHAVPSINSNPTDNDASFG